MSGQLHLLRHDGLACSCAAAVPLRMHFTLVFPVCRLDENSDAEQEDYEEKLKELEDVANPVVSKVGRHDIHAMSAFQFMVALVSATDQ